MALKEVTPGLPTGVTVGMANPHEGPLPALGIGSFSLLLPELSFEAGICCF